MAKIEANATMVVPDIDSEEGGVRQRENGVPKRDPCRLLSISGFNQCMELVDPRGSKRPGAVYDRNCCAMICSPLMKLRVLRMNGCVNFPLLKGNVQFHQQGERQKSWKHTQPEH